ncbi:pullulanase [Cytobacillus horneckiae]|uniref:type I pullulanase n=1 Tax=Cytobacillus horneckiae TaxID=549687 RepID=UPI0019CF964F|nr:type I pullulanase [Cytobacillus horneckiae]MBN6889390.1 type I pullulanase [Cytobacillus horneckiae]MCM3179521.1 type I pullulanase [Cytobacillus horneckiae]
MHVIERRFYAYLDELQLITILLPFDYHNGHSESFTLIHAGVHIPLYIVDVTEIENYRKYCCRVEAEIVFGDRYWVKDEHGGKTDMQIGAVIRTHQFDEKFYCDAELGAKYHKEQTVFRLWAPTATEVKLVLQSPEDKAEKKMGMRRQSKGMWEYTEKDNLELWRYSFLVCVNLEWRHAVDPYAIALSVNGEKGIIINKEKFEKQTSPSPPFKHSTEAIIYETHIRDLTIHPESGVVQKGKYLGVSECNSKNNNGFTTGLTYIRELGVTHIEFLPFNDFAGVDETKPKEKYNWGYNPLNYNAPEGSYATDAYDPYSRINELKKMIDTIHSQGLRVIMDVVYNHVYEREESAFEKMVPGYFFRHDDNGMPSNGTGVGNDVASERLMVRKFIVDSITFWIKEYKLDGFRFDLMGILDVKTMNEVRRAANHIDPSILIIGEGWDLNTPISHEIKANINNQAKMPEIGQFNDWFRDSIKGNTFNLYDTGYAFGNGFYYEAAKYVLMGSVGESGIFNEPVQSVNYVEVHDNHTLWDKIEVCFPNDTLELNQRRHRLATSMVLLAQGIPFLHSGQEFFRTKKGDGNSYQSPNQINQLDWKDRTKFRENVNYIKGLISIRKKYPNLRLKNTKQIQDSITFLSFEKPIIAYRIANEDLEKKMLIFLNCTIEEKEVTLPDGKWGLLANESTASPHPIKSVAKITMKPMSSYIFIQ